MESNKSPEHSGELVHGHSRLVLLLDEVDAHLAGLWEPDDDDVEPILEELLSYWELLRRELTGHMRHEDAEIFSEVDRLAPEFSARIAALRAQHAGLEQKLHRLDDALRKLSSPVARPQATAGLREDLESFRAYFLAHSRHERGVLREVEELGLEFRALD